MAVKPRRMHFMFSLWSRTSGATALKAAMFAGAMMLAATISQADRHGDHRGGQT